MEKKKILIVDDELDVLSVLSKRLDAQGYEVHTAKTGTDALIYARTHHLDLVILDVILPDLDGGQVAHQLKADPVTAAIPVMFLSALYPKSEENDNGHLIGGNVMFAKPYDFRDLLAYTRKILN